MLLRFRVSNFRSLRDEQELSMVASTLDGPSESLVHVDALGMDLVRVAAIYGANAAGKSNVLAALHFMRSAVRDSHGSWKPDEAIPREPFLFDACRRKAPSYFEVDLLLHGVRYHYGFGLDDERIQEEWLYAYPNRRAQLWFHRDLQSAETFSFGKHLKGNNRTLSELTRGNSLFLSVAAQNNHPMLSPIYSWFTRGLRFSLLADRRAELVFTTQLAKDEKKKQMVLEFLQLADLGIIDFQAPEETLEDFLRDRFKPFFPEEPVALQTKLTFQHQTNPESAMSLPLEGESRGTQVLFSLAGPLLDVLENGSILCIDELDASLHPRLALELIKIFQNPERNPKNAQLIFNTHDTTLLGNLLGGPILRRDQIWFVEKDQLGATQLYSLTDFKPRKDENIERGYLQGRYGAVPLIVSTSLVEDA